MSDELGFMPLHEAATRISRRELSPLELVDALIGRTERLDNELNAYLLPTFEQAREAARRAEQQAKSSSALGVLHGVPFGLKDIIDTAGLRTTCHSKILEHNIPSKDAVVAERMLDAGGVLMGKLATHEFAFGGPCFDLPWPPARNPWNTNHHPGGSSSGSGASVAAGLLPVALGTDTGGSVRNPASCCGLVGMKPTYGRVPRSGVFPLAYSLDNVGPLTRTVRDNAISLELLAGEHPSDRATASVPVGRYEAACLAGERAGIRGLRVGYLRHFHTEDMQAEAETAAALDKVAETLAELGAEVQETRIEPLSVYAGGNRILLTVEGYAVHRKWLIERPQDYAEMTREKLLPGAFIGGADYVDALRLRSRVRDAFDQHMQQFDVLLCASSMGAALSYR